MYSKLSHQFFHSTNIYWTPICMNLKFLVFAEKRKDCSLSNERWEQGIQRKKSLYFMWQLVKIFGVSSILCNTVPLFFKKEWGSPVSMDYGKISMIYYWVKKLICIKREHIFGWHAHTRMCVCFLLLINKKLVARFLFWG